MCMCMCDCDRVFETERGGTFVEGLVSSLIACSPSTPNLRASQACITARKSTVSGGLLTCQTVGEKKKEKSFLLNCTVKNSDFYFVKKKKKATKTRETCREARQLSEINHIPFLSCCTCPVHPTNS